MATKILDDINRDLKLLITAVTAFQPGEEGFQICDNFAQSQIKYHSYLSVNSHAVKAELNEIKRKFLSHGKYDVAKEFEDLVSSFLGSFDFERHPQYDIQWMLLSLLLNLANETSRSEVSLKGSSKIGNETIIAKEDSNEDIDWGSYLKEGQEAFFCDYKSDSNSEDWSSDDEYIDERDLPKLNQQQTEASASEPLSPTTPEIYFYCNIPQENKYKKWLLSNVQSNWWNELDWRQENVSSNFESAHFCENWRKNVLKCNKITGTVSEYKVIRELMWMFQNPCGMLIFQKDETETSDFSIRSMSIPSLTTVAFQSLLSYFCQYFKMLHQLDHFVIRLFQNSLLSKNKQPPITYQAYGSCLQKKILDIRNEFTKIEAEFMEQSGHNTLLSISTLLKKNLNKIDNLYEIHTSVVEDWEAMPNWESSSKLLSKLYYKLENSCQEETISTCAHLYISSLSVYLNIVDTWLSEGRLEDWRDEFIIYKNNEYTESSLSEDSKSLEGFICRKLDPLCHLDPIINIFLEKVFQMGRSIELLTTLDRISDLWNLIHQDIDIEQSLYNLCLREIASECCKYDSSMSFDKTDGESTVVSAIYEPDLVYSIKRQLSSLYNPFLSKAFEKFFKSNLISDSIDFVDSTVECNKVRDKKCKYLFETKPKTVLPWQKIFKSSFQKILKIKFSGASKLVKNILTQEYKLEGQLKLMRCVYMMETSHVMSKFYKLLFAEIESNGMWNNEYYVTNLLVEVLAEEWPDYMSRWSVTVKNTRTTKVLEAVNGIILHYAAGWPINILINSEALDKYNKIFRFQLKLKWGLWTLNTLRFSDLEKMNSLEPIDIVQHFHIRRLESLRFWLLHSIGSINSYLSGQVLQSLGTALEKSLSQADNLESIIATHSEYLNDVYEHCLQSTEFQDLSQTIHKLLEMCEEVRSNWKSESLALLGKTLDAMENKYVKYHTYLALGLHNAVQHKDADYLAGLSSAFNCNKLIIPSQIPDIKRNLYLVRDYITELGKNILNEIAHQSFPPSGMPVTLPEKTNFENISEYEKTFSYLQWYHLSEVKNSQNSSVGFVNEALYAVIQDSTSYVDDF